ncbi:MAG: DNRLRE domain-containing protein [Pirellulaceae bacterium]|nr:DNRLRE domain-containing protein [Pirellulaceae bacterium]
MPDTSVFRSRASAARPRRRESQDRNRRQTRRKLLFESLENRLVMAGVLHNVAAALVDVVQNDTGNATTSVTVTAPLAINDFRIRDGSNRGDFNVQIGPSAGDDVIGGILLTSVSENGRDNSAGGDAPGLVYANSMIESNADGYYIPIHRSPSGAEWNINVSAAWFPYASGWLGGWAKNTANNGLINSLIAHPSLQLGTHVLGSTNGRTVVDLRTLGIDSRTDGVLLVTGGKNEDNYALSAANADGTWTVYSKDNESSGTGLESDPVAFVYVPRSDTSVISGKFRGDGSIGIQSHPFKVTPIADGRYFLEIPGHSPTSGVLMISPESGPATNVNFDNIVSFQASGSGWEIQSRDIVNTTATPVLEAIPASEFVVSFVFIPAPTPGVTIAPATGLITNESGQTATITMVLDTQPAGDVTIDLSSTNPDEGTVSPPALVFTSTDWNVPRMVTVTGVDDAAADGNIAYSIVSTVISTDPIYDGIAVAEVPVINEDNDQPVITVSPFAGLVTSEAGGTATFSVRLNQQPTHDVTVPVLSNEPGEGLSSPASLLFTPANWATFQTVTITGVDDAVDDGDVSYTVAVGPAASSDAAFHGLTGPAVQVTNQDNDVAAVVIERSGILTTSEAGGADQFTLRLGSQPLADVSIEFASSQPSEGIVTPIALTFNSWNWNTPQSVTVTGVDDLVADGDTAYSVVVTVSSTDPVYDGIEAEDVPVVNLDNEPRVTWPSGTLRYGIGDPAVAIDPAAGLVDADTPAYPGGSLTVTLTANAAVGDRLEIRNDGTAPGRIGVSGSDVSLGGVVIGSFSGGEDGSPLLVAFNSNATPTAVQSLLRAVTFRNVDSAPLLAPRTVEAVVTDDIGGTSNAVSKTILFSMVREVQYRQNVDSGYGPYAGAADIQLFQYAPDTPWPLGGDGSGLLMDWPTAEVLDEAQVLLRFDGLIGSEPGQIPPGATIVSAELMVQINNTGDGATMHRMLLPWDAENDTWNSFGSGASGRNEATGVQTDGTEARRAYDSQLHTADGASATGTGLVSIGVTADVQAWAAGEANFGWVFTGWPSQTDGTAFSPSESINPAERPMLKVRWVPPTVSEAGFRQGENGYFGVRDTTLAQNVPDADASFQPGLFIDAPDAANENQGLIRFDDLIGSGPGQIPAGSTIHAAVLTLAGTIPDAPGNGGTFHAMLQDWTDASSTWNSWGSGIQADGIEARAAYNSRAGNDSLAPLVQGAFNPFDVTADVQDWVRGELPNYGWAILPWPGGTNGWGFASSEAYEGDANLGVDPPVRPNERPQLRVYFTAPEIVVTPTSGLITTESGGTASFSVVLATPPTADVTIGIASSNPAEGLVSAPSLTFTPANWNQPQSVVITGVDDGAADGNVSYLILTEPAVSADPAYDGRDAADVAVVNVDDDSAGITIRPGGVLTTTESGSAATFTIELNAPPTADVTIDLSSGNTAEGVVSPASLTFTSGNWNVPQTVTVTGVDDFAIDGDVSYTIMTAPAVSGDPAYNGLDAADVPVMNLDNDVAGITVLPISGLITTESGGTAAFTVVLNTIPLDEVTVAFRSSNVNEGRAYAGDGSTLQEFLLFTPSDWNTPQTVTIFGQDDFFDDHDVAYTIYFLESSSSDPHYAQFTPPQIVSVVNLDDDNGPPVLTLPGGAIHYGTGMPAIGIDGLATVADHDSPDFDGGTLAVSLTAAGAAGDLVEIRNQGTGAGQIGVSGNQVTFGGVSIGTFSGGTHAVPLTVSLNAAATPAAVQALLRSVTFRHTAIIPVNGSRTLQVVVTDGDGGTSATATKTVTVGLKRVSQFQEGVDYGYQTYTGAADIQLSQAEPATAFPTGDSGQGLRVAYSASGANQQVLLRFDDIVGNGPGQIPAGAQIVSARLVLNVNNSGDGGTLHRMQTAWDANTETWNSLGNGVAPRNGLGGVQADGNEARAGFDSQSNVSNGSQATGLGAVSIGVTEDLQAWVSGDANYGWSFLPWTPHADDTAFSPSEADNPMLRPRLIVEWVPADTLSVRFRQGVNGYAGAFDTHIQQAGASTNHAATVNLNTDWPSPADESQILLRFEDLVGSGSGQIPPGATLHAAVLTLASTGNNGPGAGGTFHKMLVPWSDTDTWNTLGSGSGGRNASPGVQADNTEAASVSKTQAGLAARTPVVQGGFNPFDVTADVQDWFTGGLANYGWAILPWPSGTDGWIIASSESPVERDRPELRLFFSPPPGITVSPTTGLVTTEAGGTAQFTIVLNAQPTADVTIDLSSSDPTEGAVSPASVVFTPADWNIPQTVIVTGVDDGELDGAVTYTILTTPAVSGDARYQGLDADDVAVLNLDDEPGVFVLESGGNTNVTEGGAADTLQVLVSGTPAADVTVTLTPSNAQIDLGAGAGLPLVLTFTPANADQPQVATLTAVDDLLVEGDHSAVVAVSVTSADARYEAFAVSPVTVQITDNDPNIPPSVIAPPPPLQFAINGGPVDLNGGDYFSDANPFDVLTFAVTFSAPGIVSSSVSGSTITLQAAANAAGSVQMTIVATDPHGASASTTTPVTVSGMLAIVDRFVITGDGTLGVLNNDRTGLETQKVSAMNVVYLRGTESKAGNTALNVVPERPGQPGVPQRSVYVGAMTVNPAENNYGDINLYRDLDADPANDTASNLALLRSSGIVLSTMTDNSPLNAAATNLAVVQYTGTSVTAPSWIATNAAPENDGEQAIDFSAAYFPYNAGWVGGSYNGTAGLVAGGAGGGVGLTVTGSGGRYEATVAGVSDSFTDGFLFALGGDNSDNYTRTRPAGGDRWLVQHRDNAAALTGAESNSFNLLYIPRSAPGLIGGVVNGSSSAVNPMRQSFGEFTIQRTANGFWRVTVPGHSPTSGVLIMETMDLSGNVPRNSYFSYAADPANSSDFLIRQFDYISSSKTANPQNGDFVFFFIPFENLVQSSTPISLVSVGSSEATLGDNLTSKGIAISTNADGTVNYNTAGAIRALGAGQTDTDTFVYRAQTGASVGTATVTVTWVGANDPPEVTAAPSEITMAEDSAASLTLADHFSDPDTSDVLAYSVSLSRADIVSAVIDAGVLTFAGLPDRFGFVRATVTATDSQGAAVSFTVPISVTADTDGPVAVADAATVLKATVAVLDVLGNDTHPDAGLFQVVGANIFGNSDATSNATTVWRVDQTGTAPNVMSIVSTMDLGDLGIGIGGMPIRQQDGVLLGTIRDDLYPFGSVNAYMGFAGQFTGGTFTFATEKGAEGNGERNASLGAAFFPLAEGWISGHVATDGTLVHGHGVNQSNIAKIQTGLWSVSIPGVIDSTSDGLLFAMGGNNDDNFVNVLPMGGDTWLIRQADNDTDATGFEDDPFSFVYLPLNSPDLIAGRWIDFAGGDPEGGGAGQMVQQAGTFTATNNGLTITIDIPGAGPTDGALIVVPTHPQTVTLPDTSTVDIPANYGAFYAGTVDGKFEVQIRKGLDFAQVASGFQFMYVPFADSLRTALSSKSTLTITAVDAVSALGAAVSLNPDGTISYDTTAAGAPIADLQPGESVVDTFSYTVTDGNGLASTATVSVTNFAPIPPVLSIAADDADKPEGDAGLTAFAFTVTRGAETGGETSVDYAVTGTGANPADATDFAGDVFPSGTIMFAPGEVSKTLIVEVVGDTDFETDEGFLVTLSNPTGIATIDVAAANGIIRNDDAPAEALMVTSLTPTESGFVVEFNVPFDPAVLNLYDNAAGLLGPADVVLVGADSGPVRGSVVVGSDNRRMTFVKTGGPLDPGAYTVTLRSAADGFADTVGQSLDGNADGTPGDDYMGTFTAVADLNAVVVSVPDVTRGYGQPVNLPLNSTAGIPVTLSTGQNVTGVDLDLVFDPALLDVTGFVASVPGAAASFNLIEAGRMRVTISRAGEFSASAGSIELGRFAATVPDTAPYAAKQILRLENINVEDTVPQPRAARADDGLHVAAFVGDTSGNGIYSSGDTTLLQRLTVGQGTGFVAYPLVDPLLIADVNRSASLTAGDATLFQRLIVGTPINQAPPPPTGITPPPPGGPDPRLFIPTDLDGLPGQTVTVPVMLDVTELNGITVSGVELAIEYDATLLTVTGAQVGSLLAESGAFSLAVNSATPGILRVSMGADVGPQFEFGVSGVVFQFDVTIDANASRRAVPINLLRNYGSTYTAMANNDQETLVLDPAPTNDPRDSVDGLLRIGGAALLAEREPDAEEEEPSLWSDPEDFDPRGLTELADWLARER